MKTLFISFDNQYPIHTEGNIVVLKHNLLNDLLYEVGAELVYKSKIESCSDKLALITAFKEDRPYDFESFSTQIMKDATEELFKENICFPSTLNISLPDSYIEWLIYHTNPDYNKIGTILSSTENHSITLQMEDIWTYITDFINTEVKRLVNSDNEIQKFTFAETTNEKCQCATILSSIRNNLTYEVYNGSWVSCELGYAFFNGIGANKDLSKAFLFYTKAVEGGNKIAANWLGWCYQTGNGVEKDETKALEFYRKGSELGNPNSDANLGYCYNLGIGTSIDYAKAVEFYIKGANANISFAQYNLANIYYDGLLGTPDFDKAFRWYSEAAKSDDQLQAKFKVGMMLLEGTGVKKDEKRAYDYFLSASKGGLKEAHYQLGKLNEAGIGNSFSEKSDEEAIYSYKKGMDAGDAKCAWAIVNITKRNGFIRSKGIDALIWLTQNGDANGIYELTTYIKERGNEDDSRLSKYNVNELMEEASKKGSIEADKYLKEQSEKEKEVKRKLEEQRAAIERARLEEEKRKEEELRVQNEIIQAQNKEAEDFLELHLQTFKAIDLYWGKNGKSDDNEEIRLLIEPARKKIPLAKAYLGMLLLMRNPTNLEALKLITSSIISDNEIANAYKKLANYIIEKKNNPMGGGKYFLWANQYGIHGDCYALLATIYMKGLGVPQNITKAIEYLDKGIEIPRASDFVSNYAHFLYAICRYKGEGMICDREEAQELLEEASYDKKLSPAVPSAMLFLGRIEDNLEMIRKAAERTDADACYEYADRLYNEDLDYAKAEKWYNAAISNSNGNPIVINKARTRLREIGGRIIEYNQPSPIDVYFDEEGPTLAKPKSEKIDESPEKELTTPQTDEKNTVYIKTSSSKNDEQNSISAHAKPSKTKKEAIEEESRKESIFSKIKKLFQ